jgi:RHS repeat-associated protein
MTGSLASTTRHDYLPFGEELMASTGLRTTTQGYTAAGYTASDKSRHKFTEQERDDETGLDYFGARYCGRTQGRFTFPDPLSSSGKSLQPQSWNRYSYVLNRPLESVDTNHRLADRIGKLSPCDDEQKTSSALVSGADVHAPRAYRRLMETTLMEMEWNALLDTLSERPLSSSFPYRARNFARVYYV